MSNILPALRPELDIMPSPDESKPGLLIRDPFQYSSSILIIPPGLVRALPLFDGERGREDLLAQLKEDLGEHGTTELADRVFATLDGAGFLQSDAFFEMREEKHREFAEAEARRPAHAGGSYPADAGVLRAKLDAYGAPAASGDRADDLLGIAAPHVSPDGGYTSYAAAYRRLAPEHASKTFIILGTSHYGQAETFGLTRKSYQTPLGAVETDTGLVDRLAAAAPGSIVMEDYCHATEHSIEFQTVFLQHVLGGALPEGERLRAVPILCGALVESLITGKAPESNEKVRRFYDALGELATERDDLVWVLGIDMAHVGRRYGDAFEARAGEGVMEDVESQDRARLERVMAGDEEGFFELVKPDHDELRWCGYSPVYTFLKTAGAFAGETLNYEQWNIDEQSVVTFVGGEFRRSA